MANDLLLHLPPGIAHNHGAIREGALSGSHYSDQSDAGGMRYTEHELSRATTAALFATPYTLVAAPGSGSYVDFLGATLYHEFDNTAFGVADGGENLVFALGPSVAEGTECGRILTAGLLDQSASIAAHVQPMPISGSTGGYIVQLNQPLLLSLKTTGITGGGTSKLRVRTYYRTLTGSWISDLSAGT